MATEDEFDTWKFLFSEEREWQKRLLDEGNERYMAMIVAEKEFHKTQIDSLCAFHGEVRKVAHAAVPRVEYDIYHKSLSMRVTAVYWLVLFLLLTQIIGISSLFYLQMMAR